MAKASWSMVDQRVAGPEKRLLRKQIERGPLGWMLNNTAPTPIHDASVRNTRGNE